MRRAISSQVIHLAHEADVPATVQSREENTMIRCSTCGADWETGEFNPNCLECGGGALDIPCPRCGGRCGARWTRSILDSQDDRRAHWLGPAALCPWHRPQNRRFFSLGIWIEWKG